MATYADRCESNAKIEGEEVLENDAPPDFPSSAQPEVDVKAKGELSAGCSYKHVSLAAQRILCC